MHPVAPAVPEAARDQEARAVLLDRRVLPDRLDLLAQKAHHPPRATHRARPLVHQQPLLLQLFPKLRKALKQAAREAKSVKPQKILIMCCPAPEFLLVSGNNCRGSLI